MGNVGKRLVQLLQPFNVDILYNSRSQKEDLEKQYGLKYASLDDLLMNSDAICLACSLNADNKWMIDQEKLEAVKKGAVLINVARGKLVDPSAIEHALRTEKLSYAGIDVYAVEPVPEDSSLMRIDNSIFSPHIAGITLDSFIRMMSSAFRNIECFESDQFELIEKYRYM